jgi:hypothetical protein
MSFCVSSITNGSLILSRSFITFITDSGSFLNNAIAYRDRLDEASHHFGVLFDVRSPGNDSSHLILRNQIRHVSQLAVTFLLGPG